MTASALPRRAALAAACAAALAACAHGAGGPPPLVLLDPGHDPGRPGATGVRGTPEVEYNDAFVALLAPRLARAGLRVALTRRPGEAADLDARTARAAAEGAALLLSIHHDSAQPAYLVREDRDGRAAWRTTRPIRGWSLFVSQGNARFAESLRAAEAVGRRLLALGRPPTLHHAEPIPGEGRPVLDARLGIHRFDALRVLAAAPCPAVLLEVGVVVDPEDEAWVTDPARRAEIADAVVAGVREALGR